MSLGWEVDFSWDLRLEATPSNVAYVDICVAGRKEEEPDDVPLVSMSGRHLHLKRDRQSRMFVHPHDEPRVHSYARSSKHFSQ